MRLHWISDGREYSAELYTTPHEGSVPNFTCYRDGTTYYRELMMGMIPRHSFTVQVGTTDQMFIREAALRSGASVTTPSLYNLIWDAFLQINGSPPTPGDRIAVDSNVLFDYTIVGRSKAIEVHHFEYKIDDYFLPIANSGAYWNGSSWITYVPIDHDYWRIRPQTFYDVIVEEELYWDLM